MAPEPSRDRGDFGRRVAHRRLEMGLTVGEVAHAAHIHPQYLDYLEEASTPDVGISVVLRLAHALDTTAEVLLGAGLDRPGGHGAPGRNPMLATLEPDECWRLVTPGGIGRLVFVDAHGRPSALPLNYAVVDRCIVFATSPDSALDHAGDVLSSVGFEVDRIDDAQRTGWSVLIRGTLAAVEGSARRQLLHAAPVTPWAGGARDRYFEVRPDEVSGRRIDVFG
jgi:nitroimidazol reductase NimA-like FMN-containing flavoprotein (pyridoxamine 5'-phosphate oxidase superfamily)